MQGIVRRSWKRLLGWLVGVVLAGSVHPLLAQEEGGVRAAEFRIRSVKPDFVATPDVSSGYSKRAVNAGTPTKWLRVEVEFDSTPEWADNVEFRWYIAVPGDKRPVVFTDSVTHINVKRGSRHLSVIFMPPRTVERYARNFKIERLAVQLWYDQKLVDTGGWPNEPKTRWWEEVKPEHGFLLNLLQTPFAVLEFDRYEQIKVSAAQ